MVTFKFRLFLYSMSSSTVLTAEFLPLQVPKLCIDSGRYYYIRGWTLSRITESRSLSRFYMRMTGRQLSTSILEPFLLKEIIFSSIQIFRINPLSANELARWVMGLSSACFNPIYPEGGHMMPIAWQIKSGKLSDCPKDLKLRDF